MWEDSHNILPLLWFKNRDSVAVGLFAYNRPAGTVIEPTAANIPLLLLVDAYPFLFVSLSVEFAQIP